MSRCVPEKSNLFVTFVTGANGPAVLECHSWKGPYLPHPPAGFGFQNWGFRWHSGVAGTGRSLSILGQHVRNAFLTELPGAEPHFG